MNAISTYLITGASRGMGKSLCLELLQDANNRVLGIARNKAALTELEQEAQALPGTLHTADFDLTSLNDQQFLEWIGQFKPLAGLVNNAGLLISAPFDAMDEKQWRQIFEVNLFAPVKLCRLLKDHFAPAAHLINIGSMGGFQGSSKYPGLAAYSASKAALSSFSECLAEEWKDQGVSVNCLAMGAVQTEMLATAFPGYQAPVSAAEAAEFLAWFLEKGGQFFNGKVLPVALQNP